MNPEHSYAQTGADIVQQLDRLAQQKVMLDNKIKRAAAELEVLQHQLDNLVDKQIPELMDQLGVTSLMTESGTISVIEKIRASIPKDRTVEAMLWLDENNHSGLVKRKFEIFFNKDEEAWAAKFQRDLKQRKRELDVTEKIWVEPQTLQKFCRSQLEAGADLPVDLFGIFRQRIADFVPKQTKET